MFLFTTNDLPSSDAAKPAQAQVPASPVVDAIRKGAQTSGTDFDYLVRTAQRESALDPAAKAKTSSASGLYQFIEQTWLGLVRDQGSKYGLGEYAKSISTGSDGRAAVADPSVKQQILALRQDPATASAMAGELTQQNAATLQASLGRAPSDGELYLAHVLGAQGAADLTRGASATPTAAAASAFPDAASANRNIFYDKSGRARGFGEVYALLATTPESSAAAAPAAVSAAPDAPQPAVQAYPMPSSPMLGLFRTDGPRGPVSNAVAKLWVTGGTRYAALDSAPSFFPRSNGSVGAAQAEAVTDLSTLPQVSVPLPTARPASLGGATQTATSVDGPLDLKRFMGGRRS